MGKNLPILQVFSIVFSYAISLNASFAIIPSFMPNALALSFTWVIFLWQNLSRVPIGLSALLSTSAVALPKLLQAVMSMAGHARKPLLPVTIRMLKSDHLVQIPSTMPFSVSYEIVIFSIISPFFDRITGWL